MVCVCVCVYVCVWCVYMVWVWCVCMCVCGVYVWCVLYTVCVHGVCVVHEYDKDEHTTNLLFHQLSKQLFIWCAVVADIHVCHMT